MSERTLPVMEPLRVVLSRHHWYEFVVIPDFATQFDDWPLEIKLEFLNLILILYNLHLISPRVYRLEYSRLVEQYEEDLMALKEFAVRSEI